MSRRDDRAVLGVSLNVLLLGLVSFITDVSSEMMHAVLPKFVELLWATALAVGLVGGVGDLMQHVLKAPSGWLSDRTGRRKALTAAGYALSATCKLFMPFSTGWGQLVVLRALERSGKGIRTAPRDALIAESGGRRGRAFGIHRALDTLGAVVGALLALLGLLVLAWDVRTIILCGALLAFPALVPLALVRETGRQRRGQQVGQVAREGRGAEGKASLPGSFKRFLAVATIFGLSNATYMLFLLFAMRYVVPPWGLTPLVFAALLYVLFNVLYALLAAPAGVLADRVGKKWVIALGYLAFALACLGFSATWLACSPLLAAGLFALYGISKALTDGTQRAYAADLAPEEARGFALGVFHASSGLAGLAAGVVMGLLWDLWGASWAFSYAAALALLSTLLMAVVCR
ncbi:MFS transporter [Candidatus Bathyarchaeota archaeon]|nr:MAG: MFS transporter [Candidatus Bathyarchaeota archaeon]